MSGLSNGLKRVALAGMLSCVVAPVAQSMEAGQLLQYSKSPNLPDNAFSFGYISGVEGALQITSPIRRALYGCKIVIADLEQINSIVINYISIQPERQSADAPALIEEALLLAFPCDRLPRRKTLFEGAPQVLGADGQRGRRPLTSSKSCKADDEQCRSRAAQR